MKNFNIGIVAMNMESNGFPKGLVLNRDLDLKECKYVMQTLLGIVLDSRDCFESKYEYDEYKKDLVKDVNEWLQGNMSDDYLMRQYGGDCADEAIGIMSLIPIITYLKKKTIVN